jgi:hypothetical protein
MTEATKREYKSRIEEKKVSVGKILERRSNA